MKDMIMKPKIWLIVIAVMHTLMGVIATYIAIGNTDNLALIIQFGFISVYLLYVAFMTEGQNQARLATVLCAPFVAWFVISAIMKLNMFGVPVADMPGALMPLTLWALPAITGIINWNTD
tara:strand:- start:347 stop:706 length:360 start_codon:yes stop_codon:yes gene_type:complete